MNEKTVEFSNSIPVVPDDDDVTIALNPKLEALYKNALLINKRKNAEQKRLQKEAANALIKKPAS
jgi:hypothetical protein